MLTTEDNHRSWMRRQLYSVEIHLCIVKQFGKSFDEMDILALWFELMDEFCFSFPKEKSQ